MSVKIEVMVFWSVVPYSVVVRNQHFGGLLYVDFQPSYYMVQQPRKLQFIFWKLLITYK
jgi:uncharacterized membrane protein